MLKRNSPSFRLANASNAAATTPQSADVAATTPTGSGFRAVAKRQLEETPQSESKRPNRRNLNFTSPFLVKPAETSTNAAEPESVTLKKQIAEQQEKIRSLHAALTQEADVPEILDQIKLWRSAAQQVAENLFAPLPTPKNMADFLQSLNIGFQLIQFNPDEEDFF